MRREQRHGMRGGEADAVRDTEGAAVREAVRETEGDTVGDTVRDSQREAVRETDTAPGAGR